MTERTTGTTRIIGLLGCPVAHSLSPVLHNAAFAALGLDYEYVAFPVPTDPPERLGEAVRGMRALGIVGCNVTVPHKERALSFVDHATPFARRVGAVNTLWVDEAGEVHGDNTDGPGLAVYLKSSGAAAGGQRVLVLGAGGSARAVVAGLADAGCSRIVVLNRTASRAEALVDSIEVTGCTLEAGAYPQDIARWAWEVDIIIQCTTLGMGKHAHDLAWDETVLFRPNQVVCDLVYEPRETCLLRAASRQGARTLGGIGMLVHQGALSFERWTGRPAPLDVMFAAIRDRKGQ